MFLSQPITRSVAVRLAAVASLLAIAACEPAPETAERSPAETSPSERYLPRAGDEVVITRHLFHADAYEEGRARAVERFAAAIEESGQTRRTYFLRDADTHQMIAMSFFHPSGSADEWLNGEARRAALADLESHYREPIEQEIFAVGAVHDAPPGQVYLPNNGDRVIVFTHRFKPEDFEAGVRTVSDRFSAAMEISGQTRRTYFTNDPNTHTAVTMSFFHPDSSPDEWLNHPSRHEVLAILEPMLLQPIEAHHLEVEQVHDTR